MTRFSFSRRPLALALCAALAVCAAALAAAPARCGEPGETPAPEPPRRRAPVADARVEDEPYITLKPAALQSTLSAIVDDSLSIEERINAIGLAGLARISEAVGPLTEVLGRNDGIEVKVASVWALGEIGDPTAIPVLLLVHQQASGPTPALRYDQTVEFPGGGEMTLLELIEDAIGRLGESVVSQYVNAFSTPAGVYGDDSEDVINRQRSALAVIMCVGDRNTKALDAMSDVINAPSGIYPRDFAETAAIGLARVLVKRDEEFSDVAAEDAVAEQIVEALVDFAVASPAGATREAIADALSLARPITAVTLLTRHFADNSPEDVRLRTIEILGLLCSRESVEALIWALETEENPELRWRAALGLGLSGTSDLAGQALKTALTDSSAQVRRAAMTALANTGAKDAVALIVPGLADDDPITRAAAARALGRSADPAALEPLLGAAKDDDAVVRATAIAALGAIPDRASLAAIALAADDPERSVRFAAVKVLSGIAAPRAYAGLLHLVGDNDRRIRADASNALRIAHAHDPEKLKTALLHEINDPDSPASADACDFADYAGDDEIIAALQKASVDTRPAVRASALRMLQNLGVR